jgi:hypothetical protein
MRRSGAFLALVFFVVVPVLQWHCVVACAADDGPSPVICVHHHAALATSTVQDSHDCEHQTSPAMLVSSTASAEPLQAAPAVAGIDVAPTPLAAISPAAPAARPPGSSPGRSTIPLRV